MQTKKISAGSIIISIILVLVVGLSIAGTFYSNTIEASSKELLNHKKKYKPMISNRDKGFSDLKNELLQNKISSSIFVLKYDSINANYHASLKSYNIKKRELLSKQKVLGYSSFKNLVLTVTSRLFTLVIAFFYFSSKISQPYSSNYKKIFYYTISSSILLTSLYWFFWSLIYKVNSIGEFDFEPWHQNTLMYVLPFIILISSYFIIKHFQLIEYRLSKMIERLFKGYYEDLENKDLINPNKELEYKKYRVELTEEVVKYE